MVAVRLSNIQRMDRWSKRTSNTLSLSSKIFPPTPEDLPFKEEPAESKPTEEVRAVSKDTTTTSETQPKRFNASTEDLGKDDWEAVEKPNEAASDETADMSDEGEKVEAVELGGSDGEKIEKPVIEQQKEKSKAGAVQSENMLAKDW